MVRRRASPAASDGATTALREAADAFAVRAHQLGADPKGALELARKALGELSRSPALRRRGLARPQPSHLPRTASAGEDMARVDGRGIVMKRMIAAIAAALTILVCMAPATSARVVRPGAPSSHHPR